MTRGAALAICLGLLGCGGGDDNEKPRPDDGGNETVEPVTMVEGSVAKGPFAEGSEVKLLVDGAEVAGSTTDPLGRWKIDATVQGPVTLVARGSFFDENTGEMADPVELEALVRPDGSPVAINVLTHLAASRVRTLLASGVDFDAAVRQADEELDRSFGLAPAGWKRAAAGNAIDLLGDSDDSAWLFAISTGVLRAASRWPYVPEGETATLESVLTQLRDDLADDGRIDAGPASLVAAYVRGLSIDRVEGLLYEHVRELGWEGALPDLDRVVDSDGDGLANANDPCPTLQPESTSAACEVRSTRIDLDFAARALAVGDVNGDGLDDMVLAHGAGMVTHLGIGGGHFSVHVVASPGPAVPEGAPMLLVDATGDGVADLLTSGELGLSELRTGNGDGTFEAPVPLFTDGAAFQNVTTLDIDDDGRIDLVGGSEPGVLAWARGTGAGFEDPAPLGELFAGDEAAPQVHGAPGPADSVLFAVGTDQLAVYVGSELVSTTELQPARRYGPPAVGDVDGDGNDDLVIYGRPDPNSERFEILTGDGSGRFSPFWVEERSMGYNSTEAIALTDLDADGKAELIALENIEWAGALAVMSWNGARLDRRADLYVRFPPASQLSLRNVNATPRPELIWTTADNERPRGTLQVVGLGLR